MAAGTIKKVNEMINTDFDKILRDKLYDCQEQVDADIWTGIQSRMASRARARAVRRICVWSAGAVAACLAAWLLLPSGGELSISSGGISNMTAEAPAVESHPVSSDIAEETLDIQVVSPSLPVHKVVSHNDFSYDKSEISETVSMEDQLKRLEELSGEAVIPEQKTPSSPQQEIQEVPAEMDTYISPLDFWNENDDASLEKEDHRHSFVSLSSNFASSSASKGTGNLPMYSPSKLGKESKSVIPTPTGNHKYYMPLSFGIQAKIPVVGNLSAGIGLSYSYIVTKYDAVLNFELYENAYNQLHYIGVPVGLYYNLLAGRNNLNIYAFAGGAVEKCIDSRYVFGSNAIHDDVAGLQYSVNAGFGVEYWLIPRIALYFDPSVVYYFDNNQPVNIRTDEPLQLHAEIGLRFKL